MYFERCERFMAENWEIIDTETLQREVSPEAIDDMILQKAVIRVGNYKYRRWFPAVIKDWAHPEQIVYS